MLSFFINNAVSQNYDKSTELFLGNQENNLTMNILIILLIL